MTRGERLPVLVVGAGPTGLTVANLLASRGVDVVIIERNPTTSNEAKAISLDDESLRTMQLAGMDGAVSSIILPGTGTKYFAADGRELFHARGPGYPRFGHPFKSPFAQPELEQVLREGLGRFPGVVTHFGTELVGLHPAHDSVRAELRGAEGTRSLCAAYVLGCDGGRSTVRTLLDITMAGRSFEDAWLVLDTLNDPHDERYGMHHGDPSRPHVIVPGREGRCRYEFLLRPGEGAPGSVPDLEVARRLLRPYRTLDAADLERCVIYSFHSLVADSWRSGRCLLLGDAAHMMPPFAGQGLNSGVRDAANLAWKLELAWRGAADSTLLDTYESERKPHAQAMVAFSERLGRIVMTTDRRRARARDAAVRVASRSGRARRYLEQMRYRPRLAIRSGFVFPVEGSRGGQLVGTALPQPDVLRGPTCERVRLDEVLGSGFCLLGAALSDPEWDALTAVALPLVNARLVDVALGDRTPRSSPKRVAIAGADSRLDELFGPLRGYVVLVRPDRIIASVAPAHALAELGRRIEPYALPARRLCEATRD